jgi:hypothetical protein
MGDPDPRDGGDQPPPQESQDRVDPATSSLRPELPPPTEQKPLSADQIRNIQDQVPPGENAPNLVVADQGQLGNLKISRSPDGQDLFIRDNITGQKKDVLTFEDDPVTGVLPKQTQPEPQLEATEQPKAKDEAKPDAKPETRPEARVEPKPEGKPGTSPEQVHSGPPTAQRPESLVSAPPPEKPPPPIDGTKLQSRGSGNDPKEYASYENFRDGYRGLVVNDDMLKELWNKAHPDQGVTLDRDLPRMDARGEQGNRENLRLREDLRTFERGTQTAKNLQSLGGGVGYYIAGDRGSDLGALLDAVTLAAVGTAGQRTSAGSTSDRETQHGAPLERQAVRERAPTPASRESTPAAPVRREPSPPLAPRDATQGTDQPYRTTRDLASGLAGEKLAAEALAADGHTILYYKPDITQTNQRGIDGVTLKDGRVYVVDNKAINTRDNISSVTALTDNLARNVATLSAEFKRYSADTTRPEGERTLYTSAANALDRGDYVRLVTNANMLPTGGPGARDVVPSGLSRNLRDSGLQFYDVRAPLGRDVVDQGGRVQRSTDATSYRASESFGDRNAAGAPEARYRVELDVKDGVASGDLVLRRDDVRGFEGQWHRSSLSGRAEFGTAIEHFQQHAPGGVTAIEGRWGGGDNLNAFNRAFTEGVQRGLGTGGSLNWAAQQTRTGDWARSLGYGNVVIVDAQRDAATGLFSQLTVRFTK